MTTIDKEILEALLRIEKLLVKENSMPAIERRTPFPWGDMPTRVQNTIRNESVRGKLIVGDERITLPLSCEDLIKFGRTELSYLRNIGEIGLSAIDKAMIERGFSEWMET